jgi:ABC-2 type transport system ATP-binding protein
MIQLNGLTKRYGEVLAVDDLTFTVRPGLVTGFLGPNGAHLVAGQKVEADAVEPGVGKQTDGQFAAALRQIIIPQAGSASNQHATLMTTAMA